MGYRSAIGAGFNPRQVPTQPVALDRYHRLSQGWGGLWLLNTQNPADLSGNGNTGTSILTPPIVSSSMGPVTGIALNQRINVTESPSLDITGNTISFGGWCFPTATADYQVIIGKFLAGNPSNRQYAVFLTVGDVNSLIVVMNGTTAGTVPISSPYIVGAWNHVFITYSNGTLTAYLNGKSVASIAVSGAIAHLAGDVSIAAEPGANFLVGAMSMVGVNNRCLPADDVAWLYAEPFVMLRPLIRKPYYGLPGAAPPAVSLDMWHQPASQPYRVRAEMIPY